MTFKKKRLYASFFVHCPPFVAFSDTSPLKGAERNIKRHAFFA